MSVKQLGIFGVLILGLQLSVSAATVEFRNYSGDGLWSTATNWNTGTLPIVVDRAKLAFLTTGTVTLDSAGLADELLVGHVSTAGVNIVSGGSLSAAKVNLGAFISGATGELLINGGELDMSGALQIGNYPAVSGLMIMNSGSARVDGIISVGYKGSGTFEQSGGTFIANVGDFRIAEFAGSSGTATISGGTVWIGNGGLDVGVNGNGSMNITGGIVLADSVDINKAGNALIDAQLNLMGGSLEIEVSASSGLEIGGDDALHIGDGILQWGGNRIADLDTLIANNSITWTNGQNILGVFDASWINGANVLYADYNDINIGKTTVWVGEGIAGGTGTTSNSLDALIYDALGYIVVTNYPGVHNDGTGDSTAGIQQAIDDGFVSKKTVLFPAGTYIISDSLKCYRWQLWNVIKNKANNNDPNSCHTLWGSSVSTNRPILKLATNAPLFDSAGAPRPMISFRNFRALNLDGIVPIEPLHPMRDPSNFDDWPSSLFYDDLRGIDFDCAGHAGAVGIFFTAAQTATLENVRVDATGAHAGIWGVPGRNSGGMNLEVEGGEIGIIIDGSTAETMLSGIRLFNQTQTALSLADYAPTTLVGFHIKKSSGPVVAPRRLDWRNSANTISLIDGIVELESDTVAVDNSDGLNFYIRNLFVTGSDQIIQSPSATVTAPGLWKRVREYVYTDQSMPSGDPPYEVGDSVFKVFNMIDGTFSRTAEPSTDILYDSSAPPIDLVSQHIYANLPAYEGQDDGTIDITQSPYNAIADDGLDDRSAIQAAIDAAASTDNGRVFIPGGIFQIGDTLTLKANTVLFGVGRLKSILTYHESWQPTTGRVVMVETADDADATTFLGFMTIKARSTGGGVTVDGAPVYDRFDTIHWRAGRKSCIYGVNLPSEWIDQPTNPHHVVEITGNGGGRFYFLTASITFNKAHSDYRFLYIEGTREPLWLYGLNSEGTKEFQLWGGDPCDTNIEIIDGQNICIMSVKREGMSPSVILRDCRNVALYSSGAMREGTFAGSGGYIQVYGNSDNILMANLMVQTANSLNSEPLLVEALDGGPTNQVLWPEGMSLYKRGTFNDVAVSLAIDADEDGLPNAWETANGLDARDALDALLNADGDLLINGDEYIAGTDPQDAASGFYAQLPPSGQGVAFDSVVGRVYSVEATDDLLSGAWSVSTNGWKGSGSLLEYDDVRETNRFYRIKVQMP